MMIWLTIVGMALVTLAVRAVPLLALRGSISPAWRRWLDEIPIAIFTALIIPALVIQAPGGTPMLVAGPALASGLAGAIVAWRSGNMVLTIIAGMIAFWLLRWLGV